MNISIKKNSVDVSGADLCWALGDNLQFYSNFSLISTLEGDEARPGFFSRKEIKWRPTKEKALTKNWRVFVPEFKWRPKKKGLHRKLKSKCPRNHVKTKKGPNIIRRSDADRSPILLGGCSQIIRGDISHIPQGFGTPRWCHCIWFLWFAPLPI